MEAQETTVTNVAKPPKPSLFKKDMTLAEAYNKMSDVGIFAPQTPLMIRMLENPASPIAMPGAIDLREHDFLHCILNQPLSVKGEAYVLGFTMGADPKLRDWHVPLFKFISRYFYPKKYRFNEKHLAVFDHALELGKKSRVRDFANFDFAGYMDTKLADLRGLLAVDEIITQP